MQFFGSECSPCYFCNSVTDIICLSGLASGGGGKGVRLWQSAATVQNSVPCQACSKQSRSHSCTDQDQWSPCCAWHCLDNTQYPLPSFLYRLEKLTVQGWPGSLLIATLKCVWPLKYGSKLVYSDDVGHKLWLWLSQYMTYTYTYIQIGCYVTIF